MIVLKSESMGTVLNDSRSKENKQMEKLLELLKDIRDDVDFENATDLIDGKILTSFDIIQIIAMIDEEYDIAVPATAIIPANFNSVQAIFDLIESLK